MQLALRLNLHVIYNADFNSAMDKTLILKSMVLISALPVYGLAYSGLCRLLVLGGRFEERGIFSLDRAS